MQTPFCPLTKQLCHSDCMLFLIHADADIISQPLDKNGCGSCAISVLSSHIASENHRGGNYLIKFWKDEEDV